jgi:hypothetical protein
MQVLVVSRTNLRDLACVGAIGIDGDASLRLLDGRGRYLPVDEFSIDDVLDVDYVRPARVAAPHVESVHMRRWQTMAHIADPREEILARVTPWRGGLECLFDGLVPLDRSRRKCFVPEEGPVPNCSTGFWLPTVSLDFDGSRYVLQENGRHVCTIPYVGLDAPVEHIGPDTLVRVSLARWFQPTPDVAPACYLQISGAFN